MLFALTNGCLEVRAIALSLAFILSATSLPAADINDLSQDRQLQLVIARYAHAIQMQQNAMKGAQMEVDIDGSLPKLEKHGKLRVLRIVSMLGEITFKPLAAFSGDQTVFKELIARYLSEEQQKKAYGAMNVSPAVYEFKPKAILTEQAGTLEAHTVYVFEVQPHHSGPGLFRGEVRIDGATGMPLREAGQLVENPHFMLKKVRFARDYELVDGISVLKHMESTADVRLFGPAQLDIEFSNFTRLPEESTLAGGF